MPQESPAPHAAANLTGRLLDAPAFRRALLLVVALTGTALALAFASESRRSESQALRARFAQDSIAAIVNIESLFDRYRQLGLSVRGLVHASPAFSLDQAQRFIVSRDVAANFPGVVWIAWVDREEDRTARTRYIMPPLPPSGAGFIDLDACPVRTEDLTSAWDRAEAVLSEPTDLYLAPDSPRGILITVPVYDAPTPPTELHQRRQSLRGWIVLGLDPARSLAGLKTLSDSNLTLVLHDPSSGQDIVTLGKRSRSPRLVREHALAPLGRIFTARVESTPAFEADVATGSADVLLSGLLAAALATVITWSFLHTHARAVALAREMTSALSASEAHARKLSLVAAHTSNAVVICDSRGCIEWVNESFERLTGWSLPEVLGKQPGSFLRGPASSPDAGATLRAAIARGSSADVELVNYTRAGEPYWVHINLQPVRDGSTGRVTEFIAIETDISTRKALESEQINRARELELARIDAEAAAKAKSAFLANMSHEIRTPMTAILGFADLLLEPDLDPQRRVEYIRTIRRNGEHLLGVINDVLDFSKIESGAMSIERTPCNVDSVIEDVFSLMHMRAAQKGLAFRVEGRDALPERVTTDALRLRQILLNLVGNAIKFTSTGEVRLCVSTLRLDDKTLLRFDVHDTGIGLSQESQQRLFTPFTQADASMARRFGGSGLGLSISKSLAHLLEGDLTVASSPGVGSTFTLTLRVDPVTSTLHRAAVAPPPAPSTLTHVEPALPMAPAAPVELAPAPTPTTTRLDGMRLLLAEDGVDNQRLIAFHLRKAGATVTFAETGAQAIQQARAALDRREPFDVILMDMQMPELDGYGATSLLREQGYRLPIIALTAHAMSSDRDKCLSVGCDDYATKPIHAPTLIATIARWAAAARSTSAPAEPHLQPPAAA